MRVAIDLTALLPEAAGVDNYLKRLVWHLGRIDHDNQYKIFVNYEDRHLFGELPPCNFTTIPCSLRPRPARLFFQQIVLPLAARSWGADVVHSPSFIMPLYRGSQRHVLTVQDMTSFSLPELHIPLRRSVFYQRAVLGSIRRADLVIVPSRFTQQEILKVIPELPLEQIRVIPHGIGEEFHIYPVDATQNAISRLRLPSSYILFVGTIEPRKNLRRLVECYRTLFIQGEISEHLVLVGQLGWGYENLLAQVNAPELRGKVHLYRYVPQSDLPWFYAGARLFVYPSLQEGFGFPPLEAMACGVPTISSLSSSLTENLQGAAELIPPDDLEALTSAMRRLLSDESLRRQRREQGLERAAKFRWEETAHQTLSCYNAAAARARR